MVLKLIKIIFHIWTWKQMVSNPGNALLITLYWFCIFCLYIYSFKLKKTNNEKPFTYFLSECNPPPLKKKLSAHTGNIISLWIQIRHLKERLDNVKCLVFTDFSRSGLWLLKRESSESSKQRKNSSILLGFSTKIVVRMWNIYINKKKKRQWNKLGNMSCLRAHFFH